MICELFGAEFRTPVRCGEILAMPNGVAGALRSENEGVLLSLFMLFMPSAIPFE